MTWMSAGPALLIAPPGSIGATGYAVAYAALIAAIAVGASRVPRSYDIGRAILAAFCAPYAITGMYFSPVFGLCLYTFALACAFPARALGGRLGSALPEGGRRIAAGLAGTVAALWLTPLVRRLAIAASEYVHPPPPPPEGMMGDCSGVGVLLVLLGLTIGWPVAHALVGFLWGLSGARVGEPEDD